MPTFLLNKTFWICLAVAVGIALLVFFSAGLYKAGENKEVVVKQKAQLKQDIKLRKQDAKIDQATPFTSGKPAAVKWLSQYTNN